MKIGPYKSVASLLDKLDREGGYEAFFIDYEDPTAFHGTPLHEVVLQYADAYYALAEMLDELLLDEEMNKDEGGD